MTESITINEVKKVENKYSRNTKPKQTVNTLNILRDVKEGKNAYDVDDPLNGNSIFTQILTQTYWKKRSRPKKIFDESSYININI